MVWLMNLLGNVPPPIAVIVLAMLPIGELRGALPVAILAYKMPIAEAIIWSILGNILPVYFLLVFFERVSRWMMERFTWAQRLLAWVFERTRMKLNKKVEKYGYWALTLFVAIPLPVTGAWTGTLAAFVFGLPKKRSFLAILIGVCISATIVTLVTLGGNAALLKILMIK